MTLLISLIAACVFTVLWYLNREEHKLYLNVPCYMLWGASIMWFVDAIAEFIQQGFAYFMPQVEDMINDAFLGISVVALTFAVWVIVLLVKDPKGVHSANK